MRDRVTMEYLNSRRLRLRRPCRASGLGSLRSTRRAGGAFPRSGSARLRLGVGRLRKSEAHGAERFLASERQVRDEQKLVAALLDVSLQPVMRAPGLLLHDHGDRCVRLLIGTALRDLLKAAGRGCSIVVRVKVELRHAQQASIAAARVEDAG